MSEERQQHRLSILLPTPHSSTYGDEVVTDSWVEK